MSHTVVVPTIGRQSLRGTLHALLDATAGDPGAAPLEIIVVDDRPAPGAPLPLPPSATPEIRVIRSGGRGPAAARNAGWRAAATDWVAFLDNDVVPEPRWRHPVRPAGFWASVRAQAGNADDVLMWRVHGPSWRARAGGGRGLLRRHVLTTAAGLAALAAPRRPHGVAAGAAWAALTARFAYERIRPGPRTPGEVAKMVVTGAAIPPAAVWHRARGLIAHRRARPWGGPWAVLFDRDDTLIRDVPYNGDPARVEPMPGARRALDQLRRHGVRIGVVSNQSGVAKGRMPRPGLIEPAARRLGVPPSGCAVIGDIGGDIEAAAAAGARGILVPTGRTRPAEIARAPETARTLRAAVDLVLGGRRRR